jgi:hypothetical protein
MPLASPFGAILDNFVAQTREHSEKLIAEAKVERLERVNADLLAALEPFADVAGEGAEDFPDDTKVTIKFGRTTHYALTLGDFRRARAAVANAEAAS